MHQKPIACILLPTFNEASNIALIIPAIFSQSEKIPSHMLHVLVIDGNSTDGTQEKIRGQMRNHAMLHLIFEEKRGLGEAYKSGLDYAITKLNADLVFEMDADLQHDPGLIPVFISLVHSGFDVIIGSRFVDGGNTHNFSWKRRMLSLTANWMIATLGGIKGIRDCTSGYRCIKASLIKQCDLSAFSTRGYSFQVSLLCGLLVNGARVFEVPIIFEERKYGKSKLSFRDQLEFLLNIAKIRINQTKIIFQDKNKGCKKDAVK